MPPKRAKKARANSNVQPPRNTKRSRTDKITGTLNVPDLSPASQPQSGTNTADESQTVSQASTSKEPAREPEIDPADDLFSGYEPLTYSYHVQFIVTI